MGVRGKRDSDIPRWLGIQRYCIRVASSPFSHRGCAVCLSHTNARRIIISGRDQNRLRRDGVKSSVAVGGINADLNGGGLRAVGHIIINAGYGNRLRHIPRSGGKNQGGGLGDRFSHIAARHRQLHIGQGLTIQHDRKAVRGA